MYFESEDSKSKRQVSPVQEDYSEKEKMVKYEIVNIVNIVNLGGDERLGEKHEWGSLDAVTTIHEWLGGEGDGENRED